MSSWISAVDIEQSKFFGENGHLQYDSFVGDIESRIVGFSFQGVRTKDMTILSNELKSLLTDIRSGLRNSVERKEKLVELLTMLYCIIGQTRDIIDGKGEYTLTYMMIYEWYDVYPDLALFALETLVLPPLLGETEGERDTKFHPYGSWKDMKYFAEYCFGRGCDARHPLIVHVVSLVNRVLREEVRLADAGAQISLLAKWIPRQSSPSKVFVRLNKLLAYDYFSEYLTDVVGAAKMMSAKRKCVADYRRLVSRLNRRLDTIQIKQCDRKWADIDHARTTSITISKQKNALLNKTKDGKLQRSELPDRIECAEKFQEFIQSRIREGKDVNGSRVSMIDFAKRGLVLARSHCDKNDLDLLNSQWRDNATKTGDLGDIVAMVDNSASMTWEGGDPYHVALSLGIRVAEKSRLGKRVLTFSTTPTWVNLTNCNNYVEMIRQLISAHAGGSTNFYAALDLILAALVQHSVSPEDAAKVTLVIFSDMQINFADQHYNSMYDGLQKKYAAAGYTKPPHIVFWNLRSTGGSPTLTTQANTSMMSGFSPALLNLFCEKGVDALTTMTPISMLKESLANRRYDQLRSKV